ARFEPSFLDQHPAVEGLLCPGRPPAADLPDLAGAPARRREGAHRGEAGIAHGRQPVRPAAHRRPDLFGASPGRADGLHGQSPPAVAMVTVFTWVKNSMAARPCSLEYELDAL